MTTVSDRSPRPCAHCGTTFRPVRRFQKYCRPSCHLAAAAARPADLPLLDLAELPAAIGERAHVLLELTEGLEASDRTDAAPQTTDSAQPDAGAVVELTDEDLLGF